MFVERKLFKIKNKAMKKLFAIVTIISFLAACNNKTEESTTNSKDTVSADSPLMDALNTSDSVAKKMASIIRFIKVVNFLRIRLA